MKENKTSNKCYFFLILITLLKINWYNQLYAQNHWFFLPIYLKYIPSTDQLFCDEAKCQPSMQGYFIWVHSCPVRYNRLMEWVFNIKQWDNLSVHAVSFIKILELSDNVSLFWFVPSLNPYGDSWNLT